MNKEMIISANAHEKRVAILENGVVVEFYVERADESKAVVGNIYKGKVRKVLPGMQSAFVDIGLERDAFLYVSDFFDDELNEDLDVSTVVQPVASDVTPAGRPPRPERPSPGRREFEDRRGRDRRGESARPYAPRRTEAVEETPEAAPIASAAAEESELTAVERITALAEASDVTFGALDVVESDAPDDFQMLRALLADADNRFERVTDADDSSESEGRDLARNAHSVRPPAPTVIGEGSAADSDEASMEIESAEPAKGRRRRKKDPATSEDVGEKRKASGRRRKKSDDATTDETGDEVSRAAANFPSSSRDGGASFERVLDDDFMSDAGGLLKEALIQEKIIEQTRLDEYETEASAQMDERAAANDFEAVRAETAPQTFYERVADDETRNENERDETEAAAESANASDAADDNEDGEAELSVRPHNPEFAARRGRRGRRRGGRSGNANGTTAEDDDASLSPDESGESLDSATTTAIAEEILAAAPEAVRLADDGRADVLREVEVPPPSRPFPPVPPDPARGGREGRESRETSRTPRRHLGISELLREGQEVIVQIAKEPIGLKGARITSYVALPGRYLVYMPTINHIGVSRKVATEQERIRLKRVMMTLREREQVQGGFIVRTACEGHTEEELHDDMMYLVRTWRDIRKRSEHARPGTILCRELDVVQRLLRDHMSSDFSVIRIDNEEEYARTVDFIGRFQPKLVNRVKLYTRKTPIFEEFGIQTEIDAAIKPRVWLKSGGFIVINQTEALVAIDVNTGKFVGRSNRLEDTITRTNLEAAVEIVRQIRLRDLGGIIVLDLIDMEERRNRQKVMQALEQEMRADRSPSKILQFNDFGLVAITRKRVRQSLERTLCEPCHYCGGSGMIKSAQTVCYEILAEAKRISADVGVERNREVTLRVNPAIVEALRATERRVMQEIEDHFGCHVNLQSDPLIHQERYDFAIL
jgi:ribonuclease G